MKFLALALLVALPVQAESLGEDFQLVDPAEIEACLTKSERGGLDCIGRAAQACRERDTWAANSIQQGGWCDAAESDFWRGRLAADAANLKATLTGQDLADFAAQQASFEALIGNRFPYDRTEFPYPYGYLSEGRDLALLANRALETRQILTILQDCKRSDSIMRLDALCP